MLLLVGLHPGLHSLLLLLKEGLHVSVDGLHRRIITAIGEGGHWRGEGVRGEDEGRVREVEGMLRGVEGRKERRGERRRGIGEGEGKGVRDRGRGNEKG